VDCDAEVPDLAKVKAKNSFLWGEGGRELEAYAFTGDDAEGFAVDRVASSENLV
jgi:hypothetical protein